MVTVFITVLAKHPMPICGGSGSVQAAHLCHLSAEIKQEREKKIWMWRPRPLCLAHFTHPLKQSAPTRHELSPRQKIFPNDSSFRKRDILKTFTNFILALCLHSEASYYEPLYIFLLNFPFLPQLRNLERKWQHHEQNNFVMKECILSHFFFVFI